MRSEPNIRWLVRRDVPQIAEISLGTDDPLSQDELVNLLKCRNVAGMACTVHGDVVGFMIYLIEKHSFHVIQFAVDWCDRRCGYGTAMMERLIDKLNPSHRREIYVSIWERDQGALKFLLNSGFEGVRLDPIISGIHEGDDNYLMRRRLPQESELAGIRHVAVLP